MQTGTVQTLKCSLHVGHYHAPVGEGVQAGGDTSRGMGSGASHWSDQSTGKELMMGWAPPGGAGGFLQAGVWLRGVGFRIQVTQVISVLIPCPTPFIPSFLGDFSMPGSSLEALHT